MADIIRATPTDRAFLAMAGGRVPSHVAAVLLLDAGPGFDPVPVLADRIRRVPRLRQRLVRTPVGCGGPIWVDDESFDLRRHVSRVTCPQPGDESALLHAVAAAVTDPLPAAAPRWRAVLIGGLADGRTALVLVLHHVVADGIGGITALAALTDESAAQTDDGFPRRPPTLPRLALDAAVGRGRALRRLPGAARNLGHAMTAAGGLRPPPAAPCSLRRRTGHTRRLAVVSTDLAALRDGAHRWGGTVNDALLCAVAGALHRVLLDRGERVDGFGIAVPVAGRRTATTAALGNQVSPLLVTVPGAGDAGARLAQVTASVHAARALATGPPPIALLGPLFRVAASLGGYRWYMNHQHRMHTLVSNVRGPERPLTLAGVPVVTVVPIAVSEAGNMPVNFTALSYAGTLTVTAIADPDTFVDLPALVEALAAELAALGIREPANGPERTPS